MHSTTTVEGDLEEMVMGVAEHPSTSIAETAADVDGWVLGLSWEEVSFVFVSEVLVVLCVYIREGFWKYGDDDGMRRREVRR